MRDESIYLSQRKVSPNNYDNDSATDQQHNWQTYYNYAQYFYEKGNQEQAEAYYAHAQHLYNIEQEQQAQQSSGAKAQESYQSQDGYVSFLEQQNSSSGSTDNQQPVTWQALYQYAQQLYEAGYQAQAEAYYSQAQLLYNEEVAQSESQAVAAKNTYATQAAQTGYTTQNTTIPPTQSAYATKGATIPPSQSEYASSTGSITPSAGPSSTSSKFSSSSAYSTIDDTVRTGPRTPKTSETGWMNAQYNATSNSDIPTGYIATSPSSPQSNPTDTAAQQGFAAGTATQPTYTGKTGRTGIPPSQATSWSTDLATQANDDTFSSSDVASSNRLRIPPKRRIKFWSVVTLITLPVLFIAGYSILFHTYKQQLNQPEQSRVSDSFLDSVQNATIQPMINLLQPAFDKSIRLSAAAGPLLYELNLTDTFPKRYVELVKEETPDDATNGSVTTNSPTPPSNTDTVTATGAESIESGATGEAEASASADMDTSLTESAVQPSGSGEEADSKEPSASTNDSKEVDSPPSADKVSVDLDETPSKAKRAKKSLKKRRKARARRKSQRRKVAVKKAAVNTAEKKNPPQQTTSTPPKKSKKNTKLSNDPLGAFNL